MKFLPLFVLAATLLFSGVARAQEYLRYHEISDRAAAQTEAQTRHLPLAWLGGFHADLDVNLPQPGSEAELTQMAMSTLQDQAVVVFFEGSNMGPVPDIVHAQDHIADDGPLPNGASWQAPKIVFTDPGVTHTLGRVSFTQMTTDRDKAIKDALASIRLNPVALDPTPVPGAASPAASSPPAVSTPPASAPATPPEPPPAETNPTGESPSGASGPTLQPTGYVPPSPNQPAPLIDPSSTDDDVDMTPDERQIWDFVRQYGFFAAIGAGVVVITMIALWHDPNKFRPPPRRGRY